MTIWTPTYRVKVNGVTVTGATLGGLNITSGRTDIYSQALAGYCNLTLLETNETDITYDINDSVTIEVTNASGTYVYLFGGFITDVNIIVQNSGSSALTQRIQIIAVGALARLNRTIFSGNLAHEFDGTRIAGLLDDVLYKTWNDVQGTTTWATYDPTIDWLNAENAGYGEIDVPGDYELHSQTGVSDTIYNLVAAAARSGLGYIYEDAQGRIGYADSTHRATYLAANGYVDLDGNHAIGPNLQIAKRAGDIRNSVTIGYGADGSSEVTDSDAASIVLYGELASRISTTLRHQADAEAQAAFYLLIRAYPQYEMRQITFALGNPEIDDSDRNSLLGVFMGMPVNINNLPTNMVEGSFQGFVEGWTFTANLNSLNVTLTVSPLAYSLQAMRWNSVPVTETWNTINPTLDWLNATIVA
jgi:hypothetical protein